LIRAQAVHPPKHQPELFLARERPQLDEVLAEKACDQRFVVFVIAVIRQKDQLRFPFQNGFHGTVETFGDTAGKLIWRRPFSITAAGTSSATQKVQGAAFCMVL
jgi:hypothetical protein